MMIRAEITRKKAQENTEERVERELRRIERKIMKAAEAGAFSVCGDGTLDKPIRDRLEALGYAIETGNQYNEPAFTISWGENVHQSAGGEGIKREEAWRPMIC